MTQKKNNLLSFRDRFVTSGSPAVIVPPIGAPETYVALVEETTDHGVQYVLKEKPYEHTPERVKSYAATCDYRNDPSQAIINGVKGTNVGDVSSIIDLMSSDSETQLEVIERCRQIVLAREAQKKAVTKKEIEKENLNNE